MEYGQSAIPTPAPGEVLLSIKRIGVCGTDLHAFEGTQPYFSYPRILGHELAATIHGHPTFAESLVEAADILLGRPLHYH